MSQPKSGITLLEVLFVIGILGLLAAVLIPAVQQARASSRRVTCQNHLHQLGLALVQVAESTGKFPTAQSPDPGLQRMLPYLGHAQLFQELQAGQLPDVWSIPVLACPSDPVVFENMPVQGDASYYFNKGASFEPYNGFVKASLEDLSPREITDGLSQTVAMSERLVRPWTQRVYSKESIEREPRRYFWWTETRYDQRGEEQLAAENCRNHRTTVEPQHFGVNSFQLHFLGYDHLLPPNHPACYNGPEDFNVNRFAYLIPASSLHDEGVNALMADGSVHFISDSIDSHVWQALGTRNGEETVSLPF